jgi:hypothetical protein
LREIDLILNHNINHTLIIDDREFFVGNGTDYWDNVKESEIMDCIKKHSDKLMISYESGRHPDNIIVVRIDKA